MCLYTYNPDGMKNKIFAALLLACLTASSSCFLHRDPHGHRTDRGRHFPHDEPKEQH